MNRVTLWIRQAPFLLICFGITLLLTIQQAGYAQNDLPGNLASQFQQAYEIQTEKIQVKAGIKAASDESFELNQQLRTLQDEITVHNSRVSQAESSCLGNRKTQSKAWCDAEWDTLQQQAVSLNQREDSLKSQIQQKTNLLTQLDDRHDTLVHRTYFLHQQMRQMAAQNPQVDSCLSQPSFEAMVRCKYPQ